MAPRTRARNGSLASSPAGVCSLDFRSQRQSRTRGPGREGSLAQGDSCGERMGAWYPAPPGLPLHTERVGVPQAHAGGFSVFSKSMFSTLC